MCCFTKLSSDIQLWLIRRPNFVTRFFLSIFYAWDLMNYSLNGAKEFLQKRSELLGKNFAALGRIIVGDYQEVEAIINSSQKRGPFLGRARLDPSKFSRNFPLFLSDQQADENSSFLHATLHEHVWVQVVPAVVKRIETKQEEFSQYLQDGVKRANQMQTKDQNTVIEKMTIQYMFHAFFGTPLDLKMIDTVHEILFQASLTKSLVFGGTKPFVTFTSLFQCTRDSNIDQILQYIIESPSMVNYSPGESNGNQPHKDYARMMLDIVCIAGILGTTNLLKEVLTSIPEDADIDLDDSKDVMLAVLEAARKRAPVNNVNVIIPKEKTLIVNGEEKTLPAGTLVAASIGLASLDPAVFPSPNVFNHRRENIVKAVMNFNAIGFDPQGSGTRQCPGRNVAMKCASDVLILHRSLINRKK
mmetsp:Transcript_15965/g.30100  ORF Transcript_15965/g.30100 Transcript_15965/m.30100 type:complete len:415 (+) Transcript_15965:187-1431(+)|eukprot:CAMPEP_0176500530 /NCGR_PEP_ID=MMETSP0200_2-20121128/13607_1 /TAXON_ID=947934 /ORGANISM="Chaetoceros sp., Strain GSL56" /LENGTH=414 /DNA_ID=CAMNT_0017899217 /DNA_START=2367 /DNA_END=3611 /DNA_ORIENTATION=-